MRNLALVAVVGLLGSCGTAAPIEAGRPAAPIVEPTADPQALVAAERAANEAAYRFLYLPAQNHLAATHRGQWIAIAGGQVVPANGTQPAPVKTIEEADAAARAAAPDAKHRFVFRVGEDGDEELLLGGCELQHVVGNRFLALLERDEVIMKSLGPGARIQVRLGDSLQEITVATPDELRMYVRPLVGPPGADGAAREAYCISTGFAGHATMSAATAAGLELWEIPGAAVVRGALQTGVCRRAHARFAWRNTPLDFTIPVAVWPK